jgi:Tol biopolymer transport system component
MIATTRARRRATKALCGLLVVAGLSVGALTYSSASARSTRPAGAGSKIAFSRTENPLPGTEESNQGEIWVMNGAGTGQRRLTCNDTFDLGAVWSPDGKTIAFYSYDADNPAAGAHVNFIPADDGDCTDQMPLNVNMQSRFPSWSVSGKIAFDNSSGPTSPSDIWVVNPDGSGLQNLTNNPNDPAARNIRPAWSPDGQKIAFVRNGVIYVMNADGSDQTPLTGGGAPAWSPNGQQIVFQRAVSGGGTEIYTMNANGTGQTQLTTKLIFPDGQVQRNQDPDWSPDGSQIAFMRDDASQTFQVFVMNADGSDQTPLTELPSENSHPGWRPLETRDSQ